jgi:hypothetical protein
LIGAPQTHKASQAPIRRSSPALALHTHHAHAQSARCGGGSHAAPPGTHTTIHPSISRAYLGSVSEGRGLDANRPPCSRACVLPAASGPQQVCASVCVCVWFVHVRERWVEVVWQAREYHPLLGSGVQGTRASSSKKRKTQRARTRQHAPPSRSRRGHWPSIDTAAHSSIES